MFSTVALGLCLSACSQTQAGSEGAASGDTASHKTHTSNSQGAASATAGASTSDATAGANAATAATSSDRATSQAKTEAGFLQYAAGLRQEAEQRGYPKALLDEVFATLKFHKTVVSSDKGQPEFVETLDTYLPKRVNQVRINMARNAYQQHQAELQEISAKYGVPARFIVSLWGLESAFGRLTGNYSVPSALATLAYEGRREALFRHEFFLALEIIKQGHISFSQMKGSWAGAMGHTQFMPSAFMKYAQDGDGDGHKDIWTNRKDAFASIANYLKTEGWQSGQTWGREVQLPKNFDYSRVIPRGSKDRAQWLSWWRERELPLAEWQRLGVRDIHGKALPNSQLKAALVMPDDAKGRAYLAYPNYQVLMHWNRSYYFVSSVGYLADLIVAPEAGNAARQPAR